MWYNRDLQVNNNGSSGADNTGLSLPKFMLKRSNEMDTPIIPRKGGNLTGKGGFSKGDPRINREGRKSIFSNRKDYKLFSKYGIRQSDYDEMFERQKGLCAVCGNPETTLQSRCAPDGTRGVILLAVDHDHETGKVRGLVCWKCNVGVIKLLDNRKLVEAAARYLGIKIEYE